MAGIGTTNDFDISAANGVTIVFTYTFFAYAEDQVKVYSVINDVETPITTGITIMPNNDFIGGTVTFVTAPDASVGEILRRREVPYTQTTQFSDITRYKEPAIEKALNVLAMQIQQVYSKVTRSLRYNEAADTTDPIISTPVDGALLGFDGVTGRIKAVLLASLSLTGLDTLFTSLTTNDFFIWNGTNWINRRFLSAKGTSIASAATTNIGLADSDFIDVTGTTTITSLGTGTTRNHVWVNFTGALILTHNATSLILPSGANITTAAGDVAEFIRVSGGNWKCASYIKADGNSIVGVADGTVTFAKLASAAIATTAEIISGTIGKIVTASILAPLSYGCSLRQTAGTVLTINTWVTLLFDTENYDDNGWHSTSVNTGRITVDFTGRVSLIGTINYGVSSSARYEIRLLKNGVVIKSGDNNNAIGTSNICKQIYDEVVCVPTDYFELQGFTNAVSPTSGVGVENTSFIAKRIR